jgi:hypothetical protein
VFNVISKVIKETTKVLFSFKPIVVNPIKTVNKVSTLSVEIELDTQEAKVKNKKGIEVTMTRYFSTNGYKGDYYELKNEKNEIIPVLIKLQIIPTAKQ